MKYILTPVSSSYYYEVKQDLTTIPENGLPPAPVIKHVVRDQRISIARASSENDARQQAYKLARAKFLECPELWVHPEHTLCCPEH